MKTNTKQIMNYREAYMNSEEIKQFETQLEYDAELRMELQMHEKIEEIGKAKMISKQAEDELKNENSEKEIQELYADLIIENKPNPETTEFIKSGFEAYHKETKSLDILNAEKELKNPELEKSIRTLYDDIQSEDIDIQKDREIKAFIKQGFEENQRSETNKLTKPRRKSIQMLIGLLAAVAALVVMVLWLMPDKMSHEELYTKFERPIEFGTYTEKGNTEHIVLADMMKAYNKQAYSESEILSDSLIASGMYLPEAYMVKASVCMLDKQDFANAVIYYEKADEHGDRFYLESSYFKMLCYLKLGQTQKVKELCEFLLEQNVYENECTFILKHIND
jgi:hypothetical protein